MGSTNRISPLDRILEQIQQPSPPQPAPPTAAEPTKTTSLTWREAQDVIQNKRGATIEELAWVCDNWRSIGLVSWERDRLATLMTMKMVERARPQTNPEQQWIYQTLHIVNTPVGPLHNCTFWDQELAAGARAISQCKHHRVPRCECWRTARERLWQLQDHYGPNSPESWISARIWEQLEGLELATRAERQAGLQAMPQPVPAPPPEGYCES
jgi:hypothetical protein